MKDFLWRCGALAMLYGGPVLVLAAIALGVSVLAFHVRAPWALWALGICGVAGITWAVIMLDYFRHIARM